MVSALVGNLVLGAGAVLIAYKLLETSVRLGAIGSTTLGIVAIGAQWRIGEQLLVVTVDEMKVLVALAAVGAVAGIVGTMLTVRPET